MRGGGFAIIYNLSFAAVYLAVAVGLIVPKPWGRQMMLAATCLYTLDKLLFISDKGTREAYLAAHGVTKEVSELIDLSILDPFIILLPLVSVACWWGFVWYLYTHNEYFQRGGER